MRLSVGKVLVLALTTGLAVGCGQQAATSTQNASVIAQANTRGVTGINVLLTQAPDQKVLAALGKYGKVRDVLTSVNAVTLQASLSQLPTIQALPFVAAANPDAERKGAPIDTVAAADFADGLNTWNLDAIDVTDIGFGNRLVEEDGSGVYIAVLDSGLLGSWRQYFPQERISTAYARAFGGGGGEVGSVSSQPNKWEHDQNSHGTHVTSTILGYSLGGTPVTGVAPKATIIPVKVLNQNGSGWSSVVARGIKYIGDLKAGPLKEHPVVINMSLGGPVLDAVEKAAMDFAIAQGVIIVASAGNEGKAGMGYPGAYGPVISVAAAGWTGEWTGASNWWYAKNVADPTSASDFYITDFSSRELEGQELDVAAPGSWVVGSYQINSGQLGYYFLGGTSMASPHVAGLVALMAQKDLSLDADRAEEILEKTAIALPTGEDVLITGPAGPEKVSWGADATGSGLVNAPAALDAIP